MFNIITDAIENTLDIANDLIDGELPSMRQVAQLLSNGLTVAAIAQGYGLAEEVIEDIIDE